MLRKYRNPNTLRTDYRPKEGDTVLLQRFGKFKTCTVLYKVENTLGWSQYKVQNIQNKERYTASTVDMTLIRGSDLSEAKPATSRQILKEAPSNSSTLHGISTELSNTLGSEESSDFSVHFGGNTQKVLEELETPMVFPEPTTATLKVVQESVQGTDSENLTACVSIKASKVPKKVTFALPLISAEIDLIEGSDVTEDLTAYPMFSKDEELSLVYSIDKNIKHIYTLEYDKVTLGDFKISRLIWEQIQQEVNAVDKGQKTIIDIQRAWEGIRERVSCKLEESIMVSEGHYPKLFFSEVEKNVLHTLCSSGALY